MPEHNENEPHLPCCYLTSLYISYDGIRITKIRIVKIEEIGINEIGREIGQTRIDGDSAMRRI